MKLLSRKIANPSFESQVDSEKGKIVPKNVTATQGISENNANSLMWKISFKGRVGRLPFLGMSIAM
jgi:hypothetical protein